MEMSLAKSSVLGQYKNGNSLPLHLIVVLLNAMRHKGLQKRFGHQSLRTTQYYFFALLQKHTQRGRQ